MLFFYCLWRVYESGVITLTIATRVATVKNVSYLKKSDYLNVVLQQEKLDHKTLLNIECTGNPCFTLLNDIVSPNRFGVHENIGRTGKKHKVGLLTKSDINT